MRDNFFFITESPCLYWDLCFCVNWASLKDFSCFLPGRFSWRSFGRPHTVALFPIKKTFCRGSSGSLRVNISISIESVLFWRSTVFLGFSALARPRLGSSPSACRTPTYSTYFQFNQLYCQYSPNNEQYKHTWVLFVREPQSKKVKAKQQLISLWRGGLQHFVHVYLPHWAQANKHKPESKPPINVKLCGKRMTDVYSLARSWNATS